MLVNRPGNYCFNEHREDCQSTLEKQYFFEEERAREIARDRGRGRGGEESVDNKYCKRMLITHDGCVCWLCTLMCIACDRTWKFLFR